MDNQEIKSLCWDVDMLYNYPLGRAFRFWQAVMGITGFTPPLFVRFVEQNHSLPRIKKGDRRAIMADFVAFVASKTDNQTDSTPAAQCPHSSGIARMRRRDEEFLLLRPAAVEAKKELGSTAPAPAATKGPWPLKSKKPIIKPHPVEPARRGQSEADKQWLANYEEAVRRFERKAANSKQAISSFLSIANAQVPRPPVCPECSRRHFSGLCFHY
jgi:hypothetical protein